MIPKKTLPVIIIDKIRYIFVESGFIGNNRVLELFFWQKFNTLDESKRYPAGILCS